MFGGGGGGGGGETMSTILSWNSMMKIYDPAFFCVYIWSLEVSFKHKHLFLFVCYSFKMIEYLMFFKW